MFCWKEIKSLDTSLFSDSTEIAPNNKFCINCCYQLDEKTGIRNGSVSLIDIDENPGNVVTSELGLDGILDTSWVDNNTFIMAGASGRLYVYGCDYKTLTHLKTIDVDNDSLSLSVDYFRNKYLCSTSKGGLVLFDKDFNILSNRKIHAYEAWVCHLSRKNEDICFSGGDDCKFHGFDMRDDGKNIFSKQFDMGVTSIGSHPINDNTVSVGSYDEYLRLFDLRNMKREFAEFNIGGGVWRHKWCPDGGSLVLIAAMYAGFAVVDTAVGDVTRLIDTSHKDCLGYGADWTKKGGEYSVVLSSFYDHRWSLSTLSIK